MQLRIRQIPIELTELNGRYLVVAVKISDTQVMQGPGILEYRETPETNWYPVEFTT